MRTVILVSISLTFLFAGLACATTHFVKPDGTGDFPTIPAAMQAAALGNTIDRDDGTSTGPGNRDLSCEGKALLVRSGSGSAAAHPRSRRA